MHTTRRNATVAQKADGVGNMPFLHAGLILPGAYGNRTNFLVTTVLSTLIVMK